jgi:hypothetical protein
MRCLYCDGKLPLFRKFSGGQFCSAAHRKAYWEEQERLAIERLHQTHDSLRAYRETEALDEVIGKGVAPNSGKAGVRSASRDALGTNRYYLPDTPEPEIASKDSRASELARSASNTGSVSVAGFLRDKAPELRPPQLLAGRSVAEFTSWPPNSPSVPLALDAQCKGALGMGESVKIPLESLRRARAGVARPNASSLGALPFEFAIRCLPAYRPDAPVWVHDLQAPGSVPVETGARAIPAAWRIACRPVDFLAAPVYAVLAAPLAADGLDAHATAGALAVAAGQSEPERAAAEAPEQDLLPRAGYMLPLGGANPHNAAYAVTATSAEPIDRRLEPRKEAGEGTTGELAAPELAAPDRAPVRLAPRASSAPASGLQPLDPAFGAVRTRIHFATPPLALQPRLAAAVFLAERAHPGRAKPSGASLSAVDWHGDLSPEKSAPGDFAAPASSMAMASACPAALAASAAAVPPAAANRGIPRPLELRGADAAPELAISVRLAAPGLKLAPAYVSPMRSRSITQRVFETAPVPAAGEIRIAAQKPVFGTPNAEPPRAKAIRLNFAPDARKPLEASPVSQLAFAYASGRPLLQPVKWQPLKGELEPTARTGFFSQWSHALGSPSGNSNVWAYGMDFLRHAPRQFKVLAVAIPVLLGLALHPSLPKVRVSAASRGDSGVQSAITSALRRQFVNIRNTVAERAAVALNEDFRSGLDDWQTRGDLSTAWSFDSNGFVRPGTLALYRPSLRLTDYQMDFLGLIDKKALSWVARAADFDNYYVIRLVMLKPGPLPTIGVERYAVVGGKAQKRVTRVAPINSRPDEIYHVSLNVHEDTYLLSLQGQVVDTWSEPQLKRGGVGFFSAAGEASRVRWVQITHQYDMLGRLCAYLVPSNISTTNGSW